MYLKTKIATDWKRPKPDGILVRLMRRFVPEANPSYRDKMHMIDTWYIEFDEQGIPCREVGVDADGLPVVASPSTTDYGYWLDANVTDVDLGGVEIEKHEFELLWGSIGVDP